MDEKRLELTVLLGELRGYARFLARGRAEADDLVQDALVRALAGLSTLQQGTSLRAWVFTILRNTFYEQGRRRRSERHALDAAEPPSHAAAAQPGHIELDDLSRALFALPPLWREALVLVGAQGFSYEEAAAICGVPAGTVKARVSRARARLARLMAGMPLTEA